MSCKACRREEGWGDDDDDADVCVAGLVVVTRFTAMLFACRGRSARGRISRIPRSGGSIRSRRACARTAMTGISRTISSGRSCAWEWVHALADPGSRYGTEMFAVANGQIPQINIWDDHDVCCVCVRVKGVVADLARSLTDSGRT